VIIDYLARLIAEADAGRRCRRAERARVVQRLDAELPSSTSAQRRWTMK
jgi:hypothetical protein